ncbi:glycosyltransferase family 4 protein, partial [Candidatus Saccharibacteria bacterium]|nr:glycosyltransferase family 4 protein [Candidatus Saccharibacteria bacterium]
MLNLYAIMRNVKILMLGWELPPHNSGGLGVACLNLSRALANEGAEIDFVVPYEADHASIKHMKVLSAMHIDPLYRYGGGAYESLKVEEEIIPDLVGEKMLSIRDVQHHYQEFVERYLMEFKPDLVHAHDWLTFEAGVLAKKNFGVPLVAHVHATEFDRSGMHGGNPVIHAIEREGLLWADKIMAVSEATKQLIHEKYDIPLDKIDVAYNSLGDEFMRDAYEYHGEQYAYLEALKAQGYKIVSTVGRFTIQKGLTHMMRAAARAIEKEPKLVFVFAGDGEERTELVELAARYKISNNVVFTGFVRGKRLRDIYSISDIFVMSSVSEPFGLTALEAAHHGNVLILTKQSGVAEVLRSVMAYDFWDEEKLADEIVAIAKSSALANTLRDGILKEYHKISWEDVAKKVLTVYNEVSKNKRN